jgi:hypothetical protein
MCKYLDDRAIKKVMDPPFQQRAKRLGSHSIYIADIKNPARAGFFRLFTSSKHYFLAAFLALTSSITDSATLVGHGL